MGAWGTGSFENDGAGDWVVEFSDDPGMDEVIDALSTVAEADEDEYLETPECGAAITAAEVVAALNKQPHAELPEDISDWVKVQTALPDEELVALALSAIERVKANSEMQELWEESEHYEQWQAAIGDLERRLKAQ